MQPTKYYCVFTNGQIFQATTLNEANSFPNVEYLLKVDFVKYHQSMVHSYPIYKYQLINRDGSDSGFTVGTFKLLSIGEDVTTSANYSSREVLIQNLTNQQIHKYNATGHWPSFFTEKILALMNKLNDYGSHEAYYKSFEVEQLKTTISNLQNEVARLNEQLEKPD
jgi:hypothetical protein